MKGVVDPMTQLKCSAQTCMYNEDQYCCKGDIMVEGKNAKEPSGTCCASFRERTEGSMRNAISHPSRNIEVDCEAKDCVYNDSCKCTAESINIAGSHACHCGDTECARFECECK